MNPEKRALSRWGFIKLTGAAMLAPWLAACGDFEAESQVTFEPGKLADLEMAPLQEFYSIAGDLHRQYGPKIFARATTKAVRTFFDVCTTALKYGKPVQGFTESEWGTKQNYLSQRVIERKQEVETNLEDVPLTSTTGDYAPPAQAEVIDTFNRFADVFPRLFMAPRGYSLTGEWPPVYDPDQKRAYLYFNANQSRELWQMLLFHETSHAADVDYTSMRPFMSLQDYASILTMIMKQSAQVADGWFNQSFGAVIYPDSPGFKASYAYLTQRYSSVKADLNYYHQLLPEREMKYKNSEIDPMDYQLNALMYMAGQALRTNDMTVLDTPEKRAAAEDLMSMYFALVQESLNPVDWQFVIGPASGRQSGLLDYQQQMLDFRVKMFLTPQFKWEDVVQDPTPVYRALGL